MALSILAIGEETGEIDKMLSKVADFYEDEVGAMVKALTLMLEPAMIVVAGGIVGSMLLAMYLPMFTIFDQFSNQSRSIAYKIYELSDWELISSLCNRTVEIG